MGKKTKTGKQRKDRYYHLAKETGYRARSAFKLIQLNRKFQFLQKSRVLIDLCAAPGGWLQVASKNMPISSLIVGVDLFPIRPIPHVTTIVADITTEKCKQALKKELQTWKADCVIHDGAPNIGTSWLLDAFTQAQLTLSALKLASEFLTKGGWFVSKLFRSKDYQPIMWVMNQLFKKVHATKPQASRSESAELFIVCQGYIGPAKIDPKFFDPRAIFTDVAMETKQKFAILADPNKPKKKKAEGYDEGDYTQHTVVKVSEFIATDSPVELLNSASELVFDDPTFANHRLATDELKHCCKDIKVLGRKEIRLLLNWQKKLAKEMADKAEAEAKAAEEEKKKGSKTGEDGEADDEADSEDELEEIDKQLKKAKEEEQTTLKRKRKDQFKMRKKLKERLQKAMAMSTGQADMTEAASLFGLQSMKSKQQLEAVSHDDTEIVDKAAQELEDHDSEIEALMEAPSDSESDLPSELDLDEAELMMEERMVENKRRRKDSDEDSDSDIDFGEAEQETKKNPLVVDLDTTDQNTRFKRRTDMWFNKPIFSGLEADDDEDFEISQMTDNYRHQGGSIIERTKNEDGDSSNEDFDDSHETKTQKSRSVRFNTSVTSITGKGQTEREDLASESSDEDSDTANGVVGRKVDGSGDSEDSDYDDEVMIREIVNTKGADQGPKKKSEKKKNAKDEKSGFDVVPAEKKASVVPYLDPEGLALGTLMATSQKKRREIIEHGYNRHSYGEETLPTWFTEEEVKHTKKQMPVTKEMVAEYRERLKDINARPIKKIAEAKARKRQRSMKRMEKLRKKAEVISDTVDASEKEKMNQIKQLYKKVKKNKPKEVTYVVAKKSKTANRVKRPRGVKGPYKVVDKRMKKDVRAMQRAEIKKKKGKKRR